MSGAAALEILQAILNHTVAGGTILPTSPLLAMAAQALGGAPPSPLAPPAPAPPVTALVPPAPAQHGGLPGEMNEKEQEAVRVYGPLFAASRTNAELRAHHDACAVFLGISTRATTRYLDWHSEALKQALAGIGDAALVTRPAKPRLAIVPTPAANDAPRTDARAKALAKEERVRHLSGHLAQELGLFTRTTFVKYLAAPGTNSSRLRDLAHSALLYHHRLTSPLEPTDPMRLGTAAHTAILEPHKFVSEYALWDERTENDAEKVSPRRGKKWDAFVDANPGKTIIRADEHAAAMAMRDAVRAKPEAAKYLVKGDPEVAMWWADAATERLCKGRADWITTVDGPVLVGLKTARDARGIPFGNLAAKLGYALQWAYYADGYRAITGKTPRMVEIVVESAAPHDVVVYTIPDEVLDVGREEYTRLLQVLGECEQTNTWPGAAEGEQVLTLPSWKYAGAGEGDDLSDLGLELT